MLFCPSVRQKEKSHRDHNAMIAFGSLWEGIPFLWILSEKGLSQIENLRQPLA